MNLLEQHDERNPHIVEVVIYEEACRLSRQDDQRWGECNPYLSEEDVNSLADMYIEEAKERLIKMN